MSLTTNIILWTVSIVLAVSGIVFGIIASYNSSKANKSIKNMLQTKGVKESARKYFFDSLKDSIHANRKSIKKLEEPKLTFFDYSIVSTSARLSFINAETAKLLRDSEYSDLIEKFQTCKTRLDELFTDSINIKELSTTSAMDKKTKQKLIGYHESVIKISTELMKEFTKISEES